MSKDFFISYTAADRAWADWIAQQLRDAGYTTLHQSWDFRPGANFISEMKKALDGCERTIAVYSPNYFKSTFGEDEWTAAFADRALVAVRIQECEIPKLLRPRIYIDLVDLNESSARESLLAGLRRESIVPKERPIFPPDQSKPKRFPGTLPPIWNAAARNPHFTGRADILAAVHQALQSGHHAALTQAIAGLGGVGKTQTALEYAHRYASGYEIVWWMRAEDPSTLATDYAALAVPLDLREKDLANQPEIVAAVRRWLEHQSGWLLIFDNATGPDPLAPYLPSANTGHVLTTSRHQAWGKVAQPQTIRTLPREDSIAFLKERTGRDEPESHDLAKELRDLPLALEQAAAYIEESASSIRDYLHLFRTHTRDLIEPYEKTWALSIDRLRTENPKSVELLSLTAFLAPDDIPRDLLQKTEENPLTFNKSIADLRRYSLIEADPDFITVHRLVQLVTRNHMDDAEERRWAEKALNLVKDAFPTPLDYLNWPTCAKLATHAVQVSDHAERLQIDLASVSRLLNKAGLYDWERAQFRSAEQHMTRALEIAEKEYGPDHPEAAILCSNLGLILKDQGDLDAAFDYNKRALQIGEKALGPNHPNVAILCNNLGLILRAQGNLDAAFDYTKRALEIDEKAHGPNHPSVGRNCSNLGLILKDQGNLDAAFDYTKRALEIDEKALGPNHPDVATDCNNLGQILQAQGDLDRAFDYTKRALEIDEKALGPNHPNVAIRCSNLGQILRAQGDLDRAFDYTKRALEIDEKALGPNHPSVATDCNNLGLILNDQGDLDRAFDYTKRALEIDEKALGPNHPNVAIRCNNLGRILRAQSNLDAAFDYTKRALEIDEKAHGPHHPSVAIRCSNLGLILKDQGNLDAALALIQRALVIYQSVLGTDHPDTKITANNLRNLQAEIAARKNPQKPTGID